ncbi:MAG: hypothetical protein C4576_10650 [Desulfobacteraceae bacterium]|jgi:hypothetical protein|nr:MAG: hypothetical protein C4576_10650 [Desulfobacteraceae bacterium]
METIILVSGDPKEQWLAEALRTLFPECAITVVQNSRAGDMDTKKGDLYDRFSGKGRGVSEASKR